jgi:integrase
MINRRNWKRIKEYLEYRKSVDQLSEGSLRVERTYLRHILEWGGKNSFRDVERIRPTLPEYMLSARLDGLEERLSPNYIKKTLATARRFFHWLADHQKEYRTIKNEWISTMKPRRIHNVQKKIRIVSLEEIHAIANAEVNNLIEERIRAAAVFWYLSGIRIGAFVSLPIEAVNIDEGLVKQHPELGVRTKNLKHATTYLLQIPELISIVSAWDSRVRGVLQPDGFWFAPLSPETGEIDPNCKVIGKHRISLARSNLESWLKRAGFEYRNPHAFRYGHIQFLMDRARNIKEFKAASMNVMHESMVTTDRVYSRIKGDEVQAKVIDLTRRDSEKNLIDEKMEQFRRFLEWENQQRG